MRNLTDEQQLVVNTVCNNTDDDRIVAVNACAGSGKTTLSQAIIETYKPENGFYTAFNRAIVQDSAKKFDNLIQCKTIHALAYKYVKPKKSIEEFSYHNITEDISYEDKTIVINILDNFYRSDSTNIEEYLKPIAVDEELKNMVINYSNKMLNNEINPTFNYMLKVLHLMLLDKDIDINFDLLILDECQDTTAVALEIFKLINAKKKIILGDKYQNIYSFMNTVNAFNRLTNLNQLKLTKSFRCNPTIAQIVETYGKSALENTFEYKGNENLPTEHNTIAYITRTNAALIERMNSLLERGQTFSLTRNVNEIFALPIAILNASNGRPVFDKKYKFLQTEYDKYQEQRSNYKNFYEYLSVVVASPVIDNMCKTLNTFNTKHINLYALRDKIKTIKPNPKVILTTAHAFKGLEADTVVIENDLNTCVNKVIINMLESMLVYPELTLQDFRRCLNSHDIEDLNTYYVALSRARSEITNVGYLMR